MKCPLNKHNLLLIVFFCVLPNEAVGFNKCCKSKEILVEVKDASLSTVACIENTSFINEQGQFFRHHQPDEVLVIVLENRLMFAFFLFSSSPCTRWAINFSVANITFLLVVWLSF